jgi:RIO-like serine/threonine protein kinase
VSRPGAPRNWTKADVRREERDGKPVVVKDYRRRGRLFRWFHGRGALRREVAAYRRLAGVTGVPACLGFEGPDLLVLELAPGRSLSEFAAGALPSSVFDDLDRIVAAIHARGVAIADLHRSNVLVDDEGRVHIVDFAVARVAPSPAGPGWLIRQLQRLDHHAAARLRAMHYGQPEPRPRGWFGFLYRLGRKLKPR